MYLVKPEWAIDLLLRKHELNMKFLPVTATHVYTHVTTNFDP